MSGSTTRRFRHKHEEEGVTVRRGSFFVREVPGGIPPASACCLWLEKHRHDGDDDSEYANYDADDPEDLSPA